MLGMVTVLQITSVGGLKNGAVYFWSALQEVNNDVAVRKELSGVLYL